MSARDTRSKEIEGVLSGTKMTTDALVRGTTGVSENDDTRERRVDGINAIPRG
jgi:hypothetical protein